MIRKLATLGVTVITFVFLLSMPIVSLAQTDIQVDGSGQFVPCSGTSCSACDIVSLANNVVDWLVGFLALLFAVIMVVSGFRLVISGGNQSAKENAKSSLTNGLIGFLIVLGAWLAIDTLMRALVGDDGQINGKTPWSQIECWKQNETRTVKYEEDVENFYTGGIGATGEVKGGKCTELTSGPCSVANLNKYFGGRAQEASKICNKESGGVPQDSGTDLCADGKAFSGGIFQINIISEADKIPGCVKSELVKNPSLSNGGIGKCAVDEITSSRGIKYCPKRQCEFKSEAMYNTCMKAVRVQSVNFSVAKKLFDSRGFDPWRKSRNACGITD